MRIYIFGNPLLEEDSLPLRLIKALKKAFSNIEFKEFDPTENLEELGREIHIIDTVEGIKKVQVITDINSLKTQKTYSLHDFDLALNLKLLKNMGMLDSVVIFGVPMGFDKKEALKQLKKAIKDHMNS